jgi:uncharacterized protein (TIGR01777 family)
VNSSAASTRRVVIAGGTGFLGQSLARYLTKRGSEVVVLGRHPQAAGAVGWHVTWDARTPGSWTRALDGAEALINLVGRSVDCVKTPDHCDEILRSRVEATAVLGRACRSGIAPPRVWVQMSTAHIYGDPPLVICDEDSPFGYGLAPSVGRAWEEAFRQAAPADARQVVLRTSFVLGPGGGALPRLASLARLGLGGTVGHGRQGVSWIHIDDMNRLFIRAIDDERMSGAYIATAPNPVSNAVFMRELRKALGVPFGLPASSWMVRMAAPILRTDAELALFGRYCVSRRLKDEGFEFQFPDPGPALSDLLG